MIHYSTFNVNSKGAYFSVNLMPRIDRIIRESNIKCGFVHVILKHTTGALMLLEHEIGVVQDVIDIVKNIIKEKEDYYHHIREVDENGLSHVLSAIFNSSISLPIKDGDLCLGEYQDLIFMDFQTVQKEREILVQVIGEYEC